MLQVEEPVSTSLETDNMPAHIGMDGSWSILSAALFLDVQKLTELKIKLILSASINSSCWTFHHETNKSST